MRNRIQIEQHFIGVHEKKKDKRTLRKKIEHQI